ncbi:6363_t:CDS:2, partial [Gigaspora margarita]
RKNKEFQDMAKQLENKVASLQKEVNSLKEDKQDCEKLFKKVSTSLQFECQQLRIQFKNEILKIFYDLFVKIYKALKEEPDEWAKKLFKIFDECGFSNVAEDN